MPESRVDAVHYAQGEVYELPLSHSVDRLAALGGNALVVGRDRRDLQFTSIRLSRLPVTVGRYVRQDAVPGASCAARRRPSSSCAIGDCR